MTGRLTEEVLAAMGEHAEGRIREAESECSTPAERDAYDPEAYDLLSLVREVREHRARELTAEEREVLSKILHYFDDTQLVAWNKEALAVLDKLLKDGGK